MFENAEEKDLMGRLAAAGADDDLWGGSISAALEGAGMKAVSSMGDGRFRVTTAWGTIRTPEGDVNAGKLLERAALACGYRTFHESSTEGFAVFILTPGPPFAGR